MASKKSNFHSLTQHDTVCGKPKRLHQKLLELIREFSKVTGNKVSVQKLVAFLYASNETAERDIKESIPFAMSPKTIRYLGIDLTKVVKYLYAENYRAYERS